MRRAIPSRKVVAVPGEVVERGATVPMLDEPQHPYTKLLIDSVPQP